MATTLKSLVEKRNLAFSKANQIIESAKTEEREWTSEETVELREAQSAVQTADIEINHMKQERSNEGVLHVEEPNNKKYEVRDLDNVTKLEDTMEYRGLQKYVEGNTNSEEFRALSDTSLTAGNIVENTAGNGGITIPTLVASDIIAKLEQMSPVFAMSEHLASMTGTLKIPRETTASDLVGFVGEGMDVDLIKGKLVNVELTQKRVGAAFQLTNQLISDSAVDVLSYGLSRVTRSVARTITSAVLIGNLQSGATDATFRPVLGDKDIAIQEFAGAVPDAKEIIRMYTALHQGYQEGAAWIMSQAMFNAVAELENGDKTLLIFNGIVDGKPGYNLLGAPVFIDDALNGDKLKGKGIIYGNFNEGYVTLIKQGMGITHISQDTTQALAGGHMIVMDTYLDGAVKNPDAFIIGQAKKE